MANKKTLKVVAGIAASVAVIIGVIGLLLVKQIVSAAVGKLMLVALFGLYVGIGILVAIYGVIIKLEGASYSDRSRPHPGASRDA
jgi:hypothetical protein